jgi:hypothetical protein
MPATYPANQILLNVEFRLAEGWLEGQVPSGWGSLKIETDMLMSPVGFRSEKGCARDARQKLKSIDPTSSQRGRPTSTNPKLSKKKNNQRENGKNWSRVPDGCLTTERTADWLSVVI